MKSVQSARTSPAPTVHESSMLNLKFFGAAAIVEGAAIFYISIY